MHYKGESASNPNAVPSLKSKRNAQVFDFLTNDTKKEKQAKALLQSIQQTALACFFYLSSPACDIGIWK